MVCYVLVELSTINRIIFQYLITPVEFWYILASLAKTRPVHSRGCNKTRLRAYVSGMDSSHLPTAFHPTYIVKFNLKESFSKKTNMFLCYSGL